jgi:tetratricopeptide (TPR) repeat protein
VQHRPLATRFGQDAAVAILSYRSIALWLLGYPDAALADAEQALNDAREIGQVGTLMFTLFHAWLPHVQCGRYAAAHALAEELAALAKEKGALIWKAWGILNQGCILALTGEASEAVQTINFGITAFRSTGATVFVPMHLLYLAGANADLGQFDDAWRCIGEGLNAI